MPFTPKFVDLVRNVTSVTGTGPVTLGQAVNGYTSLAVAVSPGEQFYYCIQGIDKVQEREIGRGTMQPDGKVAREPISGGPTNFTIGTKTIALVAAAEWFTKLDQLGGGMGSMANPGSLLVHNDVALGAGNVARATFAQGFEADGVTPLKLASIYSFATSAVPADNTGQIVFATRAWTSGVMTDRMRLDGDNMALQPETDLGLSLGQAGRRWKEVHIGAAGGVIVDGDKVIGARGATLPADATDLPTAITLINAIKARMVAHGLVAA